MNELQYLQTYTVKATRLVCFQMVIVFFSDYCNFVPGDLPIVARYFFSKMWH